MPGAGPPALRNSFSGKWGSFAQQRPLALSSVRRLQPPCNVTVRRQDALAYLRALPCLAISSLHFPRPQHELLWYERGPRPGLPFVVSVNDVPEARELYSRADSITSLCSGKNSSKPKLLVVHRGNPVAAAGLGEAILRPAQD